MRTILNKNENYSQLYLEVIMSDSIIVILASLAAGLLSLSVALVLLSSKKLSEKLVKFGTPFAAGVLLIIGFRDLLPEGIAEEGIQVLNATLGAVIIFFLIEKGFNSFHHHHEEDKPKANNTQGWLFVIGDVFHNLIDGISLGGAFLLGRETGLLATFALISHDIPLEVGEFGNQLRVGFTKKQTIIRNIVSGSTTVIGAVLTFQVGGELDIPMGYLYGGIAGFFIYIALSDIVPTIHTSEKSRYGLQTGFLLIGLIFGGTVSALAHEYIDVTHNHELHDDENHHHDEEDDYHDDENHHHDEEDDHHETNTSTKTIDVEVEKFNLSVAEGVPEELQIIEVKLGTKAIIEVNSSVNTELHIHGYDLYIDIQKDKTQELAFDFNIAGEFEIEDHNSGYKVARIKVTP